jgi:hypothetical protein
MDYDMLSYEILTSVCVWTWTIPGVYQRAATYQMPLHNLTAERQDKYHCVEKPLTCMMTVTPRTTTTTTTTTPTPTPTPTPTTTPTPTPTTPTPTTTTTV